MSTEGKLTSKIKRQITRFAGNLSDSWGKVTRRLVGEMLYGIQAAKDVKISNVARALQERIALIKTENRLCRNLAREDLTDRINEHLCWQGARHVDSDTVLAVDLGDIRKDHAKKMEYLARVRDGSTGELASGYWLCAVIGAQPQGERVIPLYGELYSQNAGDFSSENTQILKAIETVTQASKKRGIVVIDRGGDRRRILIPLLDKELRFVVRQDGDRHVLLPRGAKRSVKEAARWCRGTQRWKVTIQREGHREERNLRLGTLPVRLPERADEQLWLVVIRGFGRQPIWLLTNVAPTAGLKHAGWICGLYLTRWKCEEIYRYMKQSYELEDVRVRSYTALRNTYALVHAVSYFVSVVIGAKARLNLLFKKVCEKARRFFEIAPFFHYAVADGIHRLLFASRGGPKPLPAPRDDAQLVFAFARPPN